MKSLAFAILDQEQQWALVHSLEVGCRMLLSAQIRQAAEAVRRESFRFFLVIFSQSLTHFKVCALGPDSSDQVRFHMQSDVSVISFSQKGKERKGRHRSRVASTEPRTYGLPLTMGTVLSNYLLNESLILNQYWTG